MHSATYSWSRRYANTAAIVAPLLALTFIGLIVAGIAFKYQNDPHPSILEVIVLAAGFLLIFWMAMLNLQQVRYLSSLRARYTLDSGGLRIEFGGRDTFVTWNDINSAEHLRLFFALRLRSDLLPNAVVIFLPTDRGGAEDPAGRREFVLSLVATRLGERFSSTFRP